MSASQMRFKAVKLPSEGRGNECTTIQKRKSDNPELPKVPPLKRRIDQNVALYAYATVKNFAFLFSAFLGHSASFLP